MKVMRNHGAMIVLSFLLFGCSSAMFMRFKYNAPDVISLPPPPRETNDMVVWLEIPSELRTSSVTEKKVNGVWTFIFGPSLAKNIERVYRGWFPNLVVAKPEESPPESVAAIVTAELIVADFQVGAFAFKEGTIFIIRVKYTATDREGNVLWVDTFEGQGKKAHKMFSEVYTECMTLALEEHFARLSEGLELSRWWEKL